MSRTLVVGAGISGMTLALELRKKGEVVVLEAAGRAGGNIHTEARDGYLLERGPNTYLDRSPEFRALLDELGLTAEVVTARPEARRRYVLMRGRLEPVPASPPELLRSPLLTVGGKLRLAAEPLLARRGGDADESLEEFGLRHLGPEATYRLLDAVQTGTFAGRLDELSAASTFPQLVELEQRSRSLLLGALSAPRTGPRRTPVCSFKRGMGQLPEAMAARLGSDLRLSTPVQALRRDGEGWEAQTPSGPVRADRVVLAVAPHAAAELAAPLDATLAAALKAVPTAPLAVLHLGVPRALVPHPLDGFGLIAPALENRATLGVIFSSTIFEGRAPEGFALLTVLVGGRRRPEVADLDERALVLLVRDELRQLLGVDAQPELVSVVRHRPGLPQYVVGHRARLETVETRLRQLPGLELLGWGYRGIGVLDCVREARALAARLG